MAISISHLTRQHEIGVKSFIVSTIAYQVHKKGVCLSVSKKNWHFPLQSDSGIWLNTSQHLMQKQHTQFSQADFKFQAPQVAL